jgi:hypothetical protein
VCVRLSNCEKIFTSLKPEVVKMLKKIILIEYLKYRESINKYAS